MFRSSPLLQKKLHELEADLAGTLLLDRTATEHVDFHDFDKRFVFLQNLLSAELASHPEASDQLREIEQRLAGLKVAYRDRSPQINAELISRDDALSVCSDCTHALLYNDVIHACDDSLMVAEENCRCEKSPYKCSSCEEEEDGSMMEPAPSPAKWQSHGGIWKYCGAFGCGVILGAICVVEWYSSSLQFIQSEAFIVPPT